MLTIVKMIIWLEKRPKWWMRGSKWVVDGGSWWSYQSQHCNQLFEKLKNQKVEVLGQQSVATINTKFQRTADATSKHLIHSCQARQRLTNGDRAPATPATKLSTQTLCSWSATARFCTKEKKTYWNAGGRHTSNNIHNIHRIISLSSTVDTSTYWRKHSEWCQYWCSQFLLEYGCE